MIGKFKEEMDEDLKNYLIIHDYFNDEADYEDEYYEFFNLKLFSFKISFQRKM